MDLKSGFSHKSVYLTLLQSVGLKKKKYNMLDIKFIIWYMILCIIV